VDEEENNAMNICFLTHNVKQDNGGGVLSHHVIAGLRDALPARVTVLTAESSGFDGEKTILYPARRHLLGRFVAIRRILKSCDVVHAFDAVPYGLIAVAASLGLRKKIIITVVGSGTTIPLNRWYASWLARWCLRRADRVIAISRFVKHEVQKRVSNIDIHIIHPGVEDEKRIQELTLEQTLKFRRCQPYMLSVGAIRWRKGYDVSIRAFAEVLKKFPGLHYVIVGKKYKEDYYRTLRRLIEALDLGARVHILDHVETRQELRAIYTYAELFCLFSRNYGNDVEGFGIVFLEAAAAGLPVVGVKNCGVEDAARDRENGILAFAEDHNDADEFTRAILAILHNSQMKKRMSERSLALAKESLWDKRIQEYVDIYRSLV
jgi:phosphatidyl-myo-inositol dimannoside synthase